MLTPAAFFLGWCAVQWPKVLNAPLSEVDPELQDIIEKEKNRQYKVCAHLVCMHTPPLACVYARPPPWGGRCVWVGTH